jgi:Protein of unknown function (DUF2911)
MKPKRVWILVGGLVVLVGVFITTGISLVPASIALGPCLKDYSSGVSYRARVSPLATVDLRVGTTPVRLCYGRPAMRGRAVFGKLVPFDSLWRLGANEPTRLSTAGTISLAGIRLPPGRYSLYTIPHADKWDIFVSRSTQHWGNDISAAVRSKEVGETSVPVEQLAAPVETLTVLATEAGALQIDWETTRVSLPLIAAP